MKKRILAIAAVLVLSLSLLQGCGSPQQGGTPGTKAPSTKTPEPAVTYDKKIAYVTGVGGLGDKSFNDLGYEGIQRLKDQGVACDVAEVTSIAEFEGIFRNLTETGSYALIVAMGGETIDAIKKVHADYPDQKFLVMEDLAGVDNVRSVLIDLNDMAFLCGAFAGLMEQYGQLPNSQGKNTVGIVGGMDIPNIRTLTVAYECGVRYVNPECKVLVGFAGSFNDPGKGSELAQGMYDEGASIVMQAAGATGMGVFEAAKKNGLYALGTDTNQNSLAPDNIIASGVRGLDVQIEQAGLAALNGKFEDGDYLITMKDDDKAASVVTAESNVKVPDTVTEKMKDIIDLRVKGEVDLPADAEGIDAYLAQVGTLK